MRSTACRILTASALAILCGCAPAPPAAIYRSEFLALGTIVRVEIVARDPRNAAAAANEVEALVKRLGHEWYAWTADGTGELAQLNAALRRHETWLASPDLADLLQQARLFFSASDGYFDPAVGELVALWGFSGSERAALPAPAAAQLAAWSGRRATFGNVTIAQRRVSASAPLQLDLGAIAKGRILDLATNMLHRRGVRDALIDAGGNIRVMGRANGRPWRVAIRHPRGTEPLGWIELNDGESISTSGDYEHYAIVSGRWLHHLLNPHTGEPVTHTMAVTVVAADATAADAASTALMAAGPQQWRRIAGRMNVRQALRVDASSRIEMSPALHSRLHFSATVSQPPSMVELQ